MNEQPELNPQHIINSLTNQIADNAGHTASRIAQLNAIIAQQAEQLEEQAVVIQKQEIAEMDEEAN